MAATWVRIGLLGAVLVGLGISHYVCFRKGYEDHARQLTPAVERVRSQNEPAHLRCAVLALRPIAGHPNVVPTPDVSALCDDAERYVRVVERDRIPELRDAGDQDGVRRLEALVGEAKGLIRRLRK